MIKMNNRYYQILGMDFVRTFGIRSRMMKLVEEMNELSAKILKLIHDNSTDMEQVTLEMVDVDFLMTQLKMFIGNEKFTDAREIKCEQWKRILRERDEGI